MENRFRPFCEELEDRTVPSCLWFDPRTSDALHARLGDALSLQPDLLSHVAETRGDLSFLVPDIDCMQEHASGFARLHPSLVVTPRFAFTAKDHEITFGFTPLPEGVSARITYRGALDGYADGAVERFALPAGTDVRESIRIPSGSGSVMVEIIDDDAVHRSITLRVSEGKIASPEHHEGEVKSLRFARKSEESDDEEESMAEEFGGGEEGGDEGVETEAPEGDDGGESAEATEVPEESEEIEWEPGGFLALDGEPDGEKDGELDGMPDGEVDPVPGERRESAETSARDAVFATDFAPSPERDVATMMLTSQPSRSSLDAAFAEMSRTEPPPVRHSETAATPGAALGAALAVVAPAVVSKQKSEPKGVLGTLRSAGRWLKKTFW